MNFCMVGIDYHQAPVAVRERAFLSRDRVSVVARDLMALFKAQGVFILSTCARTEIYAQGISVEELQSAFIMLCQGEKSFLELRQGRDAIAHLFTVASGAESPVFGDSNIVRQIKEAYFLGRETGTLTRLLSRVLERTLCAGRDIRRALQLTQREGDVAVRAIQLAIQKHKGLKGKNIYVIGCGVVGQSLIEELCQQRARIQIVANRRHDRASFIAQEHGCLAVRFEDFYNGLAEADLIFSATNSPHYVVSRDMFERRVPADKEMVIFDLAVPRDIDNNIEGFSGVRIYTIDDIGAPGEERLVSQARHIAHCKAKAFFAREKIHAV